MTWRKCPHCQSPHIMKNGVSGTLYVRGVTQCTEYQCGECRKISYKIDYSDGEYRFSKTIPVLL